MVWEQCQYNHIHSVMKKFPGNSTIVSVMKLYDSFYQAIREMWSTKKLGITKFVGIGDIPEVSVDQGKDE